MTNFDDIDKLPKIDKYLIGTTAIAKLGDISREFDKDCLIENLCHVNREDDKNYYGMWITGFGFFNVKFPKETTRELTQEEIEYCNTKRVRINNQPSMSLKVN